MIYDLANPLHRESFKIRCSSLFNKEAVVELTEKKPQRTVRQNAYLHAALGYFALQTGYSLQDVKQWYFKEACNPDLFIREVEDRLTGTVRKVLRSTGELTTEEMSLAITRFRDWALTTADIYIPSPEDTRAVLQMQIEGDRAKRWI